MRFLHFLLLSLLIFSLPAQGQSLIRGADSYSKPSVPFTDFYDPDNLKLLGTKCNQQKDEAACKQHKLGFWFFSAESNRKQCEAIGNPSAFACTNYNDQFWLGVPTTFLAKAPSGKKYTSDISRAVYYDSIAMAHEFDDRWGTRQEYKHRGEVTGVSFIKKGIYKNGSVAAAKIIQGYGESVFYVRANIEWYQRSYSPDTGYVTKLMPPSWIVAKFVDGRIVGLRYLHDSRIFFSDRFAFGYASNKSEPKEGSPDGSKAIVKQIQEEDAKKFAEKRR